MDLAETLLDAGVLRIPNFLSAEECRSLAREVCTSDKSDDSMLFDGKYVVDKAVLRHRGVLIRPEAHVAMRERLSALVPFMAARFGKPLTGMQEPEFFLYNEGDFIVFHRDASGAATEPARIRAMKVSVVVFLTDEKPVEKGGFQGGALEFLARDLVTDPQYEGAKVAIHGEAGLLVAFDPRTRHQVEVVKGGSRVTLVSWFV